MSVQLHKWLSSHRHISYVSEFPCMYFFSRWFCDVKTLPSNSSYKKMNSEIVAMASWNSKLVKYTTLSVELKSFWNMT